MDTKLSRHSQVRSGNKRGERYRKVGPVVSHGDHDNQQQAKEEFTKDYIKVRKKDNFSKHAK